MTASQGLLKAVSRFVKFRSPEIFGRRPALLGAGKANSWSSLSHIARGPKAVKAVRHPGSA